MKIRDSKGNIAPSSYVAAAKMAAQQDRQRQRGFAVAFGKFAGTLATVAILAYVANSFSGMGGTDQPVQDQVLLVSLESTAQTEQATATATNHRARKGKEETIVEVVDLVIATPAQQQEVTQRSVFAQEPIRAGETVSSNRSENQHNGWWDKWSKRVKKRVLDSTQDVARTKRQRTKDGHWHR